MQSIYNIIVEPKGERYNNKKNGIIYNTHIDEKDFHYTNRIGIVKSLPLIDTPFEVGDEVIVHHNVFRKYWGFSGHLRTSSNDIDNNLFKVPQEQVYAYKRNGEWTAIDKWVFVKPIKADKGSIIYDLNTEVEREGIIAFGAPEGFKIGDRVAFTPHSEYEFNIDDEKLYRMRHIDLIAILYHEDIREKETTVEIS